jgi:hypothetical protein
MFNYKFVDNYHGQYSPNEDFSCPNHARCRIVENKVVEYCFIKDNFFISGFIISSEFAYPHNGFTWIRNNSTNEIIYKLNYIDIKNQQELDNLIPKLLKLISFS